MDRSLGLESWSGILGVEPWNEILSVTEKLNSGGEIVSGRTSAFSKCVTYA